MPSKHPFSKFTKAPAKQTTNATDKKGRIAPHPDSLKTIVATAHSKLNKKKHAPQTGYNNNSSGATASIDDKSEINNIRSRLELPLPTSANAAQMPLNKKIAHGGICSRREAVDLIKQGIVAVNGNVVKEPAYKVSTQDNVTIRGKKVSTQKNLVYLLLNKPKDYITTTKDEIGRKTVLDIVRHATTERIFPVGRLDRNTTGVLLLTNDGELTDKLTHPSYEVKKIYEARLNKPFTKKDFETMLSGVTLEDGFVKVDALGYADPTDKAVIGVEIHSGKNRIVRRIFEQLGYDVRNLDRVLFANLTKKNVERGKFRFLAEKEIRSLKFLNQSFLKKKRSKNQS